MSALRYALPFGGRAKLTIDVTPVLDRYRQTREEDTEAGGSILGRMMRDSLDIVVDEITEPGPKDVRTRFGFHLVDHDHHQAAMDAAFARSMQTCGYLGDWHTHAEPDPTPSNVDLDNWRRLLRVTATDEFPRLLFLIVGTERVRAWQGDRVAGDIREATPLDADNSIALDNKVRAAFAEHRSLAEGASR